MDHIDLRRPSVPNVGDFRLAWIRTPGMAGIEPHVGDLLVESR